MSTAKDSQDQSRFGRSTADAGAPAAPQARTPAADPAWRRTGLILFVGVVAIILLYWPAAEAAVQVWYASTAYNHCFLIPFIIAYLLWERRAVLAPLRPQPTLWPLPIMLGISIVALLGNVMSIMEVQHFALVAMLLTFVLAVVGWTVFRSMLFPMLYLFFMVPSGEFLVPKLQDFTASFVVLGLQLVGIPVFSDGIFIKIPNGLFEVAEACAGLRFLIASVAFGFLFSYLMYQNWRKRAVFVILSFIVPIIANGLRAFGIVIIAHATDGRVAAGVDHIVYGWGFFVAIMLTMMWVGLKFRDNDAPLAAVTVTPGAGRVSHSALAVGLVAVLAAAAAPAYGYWLDHRKPDHQLALTAPKAETPWRISPDARDRWQPTFAGADGELREAYRGPNGDVQLYIAYFASQRHGAKIISAQNRIEDEEAPWRRASTGTAMATVDGRPMVVAKQILTAGQARRIAWYLYWVDGQLTASGMRAKLLGARGTLLTGNPQAAAIVIAADAGGNDEDAERRIQDFLAHMEPIAPFLRQVTAR